MEINNIVNYDTKNKTNIFEYTNLMRYRKNI